MIGVTPTTVSPSSWRMRRNTPWVLGCCGPMLRVSSLSFSDERTASRPGTARALPSPNSELCRVVVSSAPAPCDPLVAEPFAWGAPSSRGVSSTERSDTSESFLTTGRGELALDAVTEMSHQDIRVVERPILAERVTRETVLEQDAAQVRVPDELHAHQVVDLALLEVGARPDRRKARAERVRLGRQVEPEDDAARVLDVIEAVDVVEHLEAVAIVDGRDGGEVVGAHREH